MHIYKTFNALILGLKLYIIFKGLCGGSDSKESAYNAGDPVRIPELGRYPGEGNYVFIDEGTLFFFFLTETGLLLLKNFLHQSDPSVLAVS